MKKPLMPICINECYFVKSDGVLISTDSLFGMAFGNVQPGAPPDVKRREPCLPPSNQSPEGSGRRPNSRFRPQASHVQRTSRTPWPGFRESRPVRHDGSCNTATDPSLQPLHPPREQSPAQHCSLSTEDLMSKGTPGEDLQTGHQGAGPGRGSGRQPSSHTLSM